MRQFGGIGSGKPFLRLAGAVPSLGVLRLSETALPEMVHYDFGRLAQLVRACASHAQGHRFEPCSAHHFRQSIQCRSDSVGTGVKVALRDGQPAKTFRDLAPKDADIPVAEIVR